MQNSEGKTFEVELASLLGADISCDEMKNKLSVAAFTLKQCQPFAWRTQEKKEVDLERNSYIRNIGIRLL